MTEPRFYTRELIGIPIPMPPKRTSGREKLSVYVLDRLYNCKVVATVETTTRWRRRNREALRAQASAECAALNAWWEQERDRD